MLMLQNDCRTTHIQLLSFVICSSLKSQHTSSLNCESWNISITVKVEILLSLWKGLANADPAMTSTFSNNAWKNVICLWMVTQSHRSTNTTQYLTTGMNISMFSKQILVSTLVCCSIWEFAEKIHFRFWDMYLVFWDVDLIRIQRFPLFLFTIYKCCRFRFLFADR